MPAQFVAAYDKLLAEYCDQLGHESRDESFARVFRQLFAIVQEMYGEDADDAYGHSGPVTDNFEEYVDIVVKAGRNEDVRQLIQGLEPHWDHNLGYGQLGSAAYQSGDFSTAERLFTKLKDSMPNWQRSEHMGVLASIWNEQGNADKARQLLIDCLRGVVAEASEATGPDRELFEEWFQNHRTTYVQLFGDNKDELRKAGIPDSTLK